MGEEGRDGYLLRLCEFDVDLEMLCSHPARLFQQNSDLPVRADLAHAQRAASQAPNPDQGLHWQPDFLSGGRPKQRQAQRET